MNSGKYDVVVIGSGVGGMSVAALLAHEGNKTLVIERLPLLGGRCSTMMYKGFRMSTGAITLPQRIVGDVFTKVGLSFDIFAEPGSCFRVGGQDYVMPASGGINWLIAQVARNSTEADRVINALRKARSWMEPSATISTEEWLRQSTDNEKILDIFRAIIPALAAVNASEFPANQLVAFLNLARDYRVSGFARNGNLSLWESLAKVVHGKGGDVWTSCAAKHISVVNGKVSGIVAEKDGRDIEIGADVVISNVGPKKTVELAGVNNFDRGYLKEMAEKLMPAPVLWLHTAIHTPNFNHPGVLQLTGTRRINTCTCLTKSLPELAPKGVHLMVTGGTPKSCLPPFDFQQELKANVMDLSDNFPEFNRYGEILMASWYQGEWPAFRTWPGRELPQKTPVENLYNVGDAVSGPGRAGTIGAGSSAWIVAEEVTKRRALSAR